MSPFKRALLLVIATIVCFTLLYFILKMYQIRVLGMSTLEFILAVIAAMYIIKKLI